MQATDGTAVLLVEDNPGDVELIRLALGECVGPGALRVIRDGRAAFEFVTTEALPPAMFVLLDLNLPGCNGFEILEAIQGLPGDRVRVRAIVLSSSSRPSDRERALALGAAQYVRKPADVEELDALHERLCAMLQEFESETLH